MTATRFPPHGPVLVRATPAGRWLCCVLCERIRFAGSDDAAKAFLGAHDPEPDAGWLARMAQAQEELPPRPLPGWLEAGLDRVAGMEVRS